MKNHKMMWRVFAMTVAFFAALILIASPVLADDDDKKGCKDLPSQGDLKDALTAVVATGGNAGLGNDMWATVVNRDGVVCAVAFSGIDRGDQWPGSRAISAQKANTANAFSRPEGIRGFAAPLSTANLYTAVQPGGSLFGLQFSNPVDTKTAYRGKSKKYGTKNDPMVGRKIGGVNVFGGGLALYEEGSSILVGALGVSGDTSCTDHIIAWKVRDGLGLDNIPGGVAPGVGCTVCTDNIIINPADAFEAAFAHPTCAPVGGFPDTIAENLPISNPIGP